MRIDLIVTTSTRDSECVIVVTMRERAERGSCDEGE